MKLFFAFLLFSSCCYGQIISSPDSAHFYNGWVTTVCGEIVSTREGKSGVVFLDFDKAYPHQTFTAVVFKDLLETFRYNIVTLKGKKVCVTGIVKMQKGIPEIIIEKGNQIREQK